MNYKNHSGQCLKLVGINPFLIGVLFFLIGCSTSQYPTTLVQQDIVKSTKRIKQTFKYKRAQEKVSPLQSLHQEMLKVVGNNMTEQYTVYDRLNMKANSYVVDKQIYIIVDGEVFQIDIDSQERENTSKISQSTSNITTIDSTSMDVVTGYTQHKRSIFRISYTLSQEIIEKLSVCNNVMFRYYSGPNMITTSMSNKKIVDLKKFIQL